MGPVQFFRSLWHFSHSVQLDVSAHLSALDDEEFFVIEGSGCRGRRESDSQVFCHPNAVLVLAYIDKDIRHTSCPHHHHHHLLLVAYRLWASFRLGHLREWVEGWLLKCVYSLGNGLSSVEAWFSTALDIEEVLSGIGGDQLHVMVADVIKSFDTVDRSILNCALGRLGLPDWFRKVYFSFHSQVRLRFKLAAGLGQPWCRDGGIPQGCPLSMVFIVALYVPWCRHLESLPDVKPQLYADNLKCSAARPRALFESAHFTAQYVRSVGQDVSPGKCVLLSTSRAVRRAMKLWDISGDGGFWKFQLDVRDLGGHLDFTYRARAGTLSHRVGKATVGVAAVGALPLDFQVNLGLVRGKYLSAGLHAAEAFYVSSSSISAFRAAIVREVWSTKMPLASTPVLLNLLDGPFDVDPAFYVIWSRFRMMRRFLAYCPEEEPRISRMLDLISRGSQGHGLVHLLLISAAELGFAWDADEQGWIRVSLPPLRMMTGLFNIFELQFWRLGIFTSFLGFLSVRVFGVLNLLILRALYNYLTRPI